jgi:hypothetical protein
MGGGGGTYGMRIGGIWVICGICGILGGDI